LSQLQQQLQAAEEKRQKVSARAAQLPPDIDQVKQLLDQWRALQQQLADAAEQAKNQPCQIVQAEQLLRALMLPQPEEPEDDKR
jgi:chromosome segregation ATPase